MNNVRANVLSARRRIAAYAVLALMALALAVFLVSAPSAYADHEDGHDAPTEAPDVPVPDDVADPINLIGGL